MTFSGISGFFPPCTPVSCYCLSELQNQGWQRFSMFVYSNREPSTAIITPEPGNPGASSRCLLSSSGDGGSTTSLGNIPVPDLSVRKQTNLISNLNLSTRNLRPFPTDPHLTTTCFLNDRGEGRKGVNKTSVLDLQRMNIGLFRTLVQRVPW